ncbi:hypothetical protein D3C72_1577590 [compost metagenome]
MQQPKSRWDDTPSFGAGYSSPGWKRAQSFTSSPPSRSNLSSTPARKAVIQGQARPIAPPKPSGDWSRGDRVFHQKFGYGDVRAVEGNKLVVDFEKAGEKKVIDSFVEKAS